MVGGQDLKVDNDEDSLTPDCPNLYTSCLFVGNVTYIPTKNG